MKLLKIQYYLINGRGLISKAVQLWDPSDKISFNNRGAPCDSSFDFGAEIFLIFWIWTIIFPDI